MEPAWCAAVVHSWLPTRVTRRDLKNTDAWVPHSEILTRLVEVQLGTGIFSIPSDSCAARFRITALGYQHLLCRCCPLVWLCLVSLTAGLQGPGPAAYQMLGLWLTDEARHWVHLCVLMWPQHGRMSQCQPHTGDRGSASAFTAGCCTSATSAPGIGFTTSSGCLSGA